MRRPLRDQHHFRFSHFLRRYDRRLLLVLFAHAAAPNRLDHVYFDHIHAAPNDLSILARLPSPSKPQNATPDNLAVRRINRVHFPKISSRNDELPESEWIAGEAGRVGEYSGRDGGWVGPRCEPDCKVEEVPREVLPFRALVNGIERMQGK